MAWLSDRHDAAMFNIPGFQLISQNDSCSAHSGLIIFLTDSYSCLIKSVHTNWKLWDGLFMEVAVKYLREKV